MLQLPFCCWLGQVFLHAWGRGQAWQRAKGGGEKRSERTGAGGAGARVAPGECEERPMWLSRTEPPAGTLFCVLTCLCGGLCEGWGRPTSPACAVVKWLPIPPLRTPPRAHWGLTPCSPPNPILLRPVGGQTPRSIMAKQRLEGKGPEAAMRQTGTPQMSLLPDKWVPHKREGP